MSGFPGGPPQKKERKRMAFNFSKKLSAAAATGLMLGAISACGGSAQPAEIPTEPPPAAEPAPAATDAPAADAPAADGHAAAAEGKACCAGKNECKGKGGCKAGGNCAGKNECKGKGGCSAHCPK
jgi:hypothetical protein